MPDEPTTNTQDLANTEYDAERWARVEEARQADTEKAAPVVVDADRPEVGLSQKGTDEAATVKR